MTQNCAFRRKLILVDLKSFIISEALKHLKFSIKYHSRKITTLLIILLQ